MSFFIATEKHFKSLGFLHPSSSFSKANTSFETSNTLIYRPLNRLVDAQFKIYPSLRRLCKLVHIDIEPYSNVENIVQKTQKNWLRKPEIERHELTQSTYDLHKDQMMPLLKDLNVIQTIRAKYTDKLYDIVLVHGATADAVITRLQFLIDEYQRGVRFKKVILLSGDRPLDPQQERKYIKLGLKTEADMFLYIWKKMPGLPNTIKQDFYLVNTKGKILKGQYKRPTTRDTIYGFLNEVSFHPNSRCLAISHQPFVPFQDFVFYNILKEKYSYLYLETIGQSADPSEPMALHLDNLARCLYELQFSTRLKSHRSS